MRLCLSLISFLIFSSLLILQKMVVVTRKMKFFIAHLPFQVNIPCTFLARLVLRIEMLFEFRLILLDWEVKQLYAFYSDCFLNFDYCARTTFLKHWNPQFLLLMKFCYCLELTFTAHFIPFFIIIF